MQELDDPADTRRALRAELRLVVYRDLILPVVATSVLAFTLLPAPRFIAWLALLCVPAMFGYLASRACGLTAAAAAALLYLWAYGHPRFATTITDPWTIRVAFLLGLLGALAAAIGSWRHDVRGTSRAEPTEPANGFSRAADRASSPRGGRPSDRAPTPASR
jgi:hypothetical protein